MDTFKILFLIIGVIIIWAICVCIYLRKRYHFTCPECKYEFKPTYLQLIFSVNAIAGKVLKCPNCKASVYMEPEKDNR